MSWFDHRPGRGRSCDDLGGTPKHALKARAGTVRTRTGLQFGVCDGLCIPGLRLFAAPNTKKRRVTLDGQIPLFVTGRQDPTSVLASLSGNNVNLQFDGQCVLPVHTVTFRRRLPDRRWQQRMRRAHLRTTFRRLVEDPMHRPRPPPSNLVRRDHMLFACSLTRTIDQQLPASAHNCPRHLVAQDPRLARVVCMQLCVFPIQRAGSWYSWMLLGLLDEPFGLEDRQLD